jgi:tRNA (guanine37-N1)-methyltransferase
MHKYSVLTIFPEMFKSLSESGITSRVLSQNLAQLDFYNPRDYTDDNYQSVDDTPFGGGQGMVMKPEPLYLAHSAATKNIDKNIDKTNNSNKSNAKTIYFAPQGEVLTQKKVEDLAKCENLILVCGRYEGVDQRFIDTCVDEVISVGDYVLTGGELPAMMLLDAILRLLPGAIKEDSHKYDSFSDNLLGLLEERQYTKPSDWRGQKVPDVLLSGNHQKIKDWHELESLELTSKLRPELLYDLLIKMAKNANKTQALAKLSKLQKKWLEEYILAGKNQI